MRLNTKYSLKSDGSAPEVVDQLFGSAERKRARPESSLDIKVTNGETLARPPQKNKSLKDGKSVARENQNVGVRKKYEISDIERMTEDEILQALYDDPEFAKKAGEVAEKLRENRATPNPGPKKNRKEITNSHPAHLRAMMEEGVPIKQWIILLVLLFAGLYQLRKVLVGSTTAKVKDLNLKKAGKKQPIRKEAKKRKERKAPSMATPLKKSDKTSTDIVVVRNVAEVVTTNKKKKVKKPPKQKELKNGTTIHEPKTIDSPGSISTDGSSSMDGGADAKMQPNGEPIDKENQPNFNSFSNPNEKNIVIPETDEVTELNSKSCTKEKLVKKKKKMTTQEGNKIEVSFSSHSSPQPLNVITDDDNNKVTILEETLNIVNDEALALEMHLQEEMLVQHEAKQAVAKSQQEEWEEVSTKKKKR
jgi:hypothetical protein